jgi:hypothetical protein
VVFVAEFGEAAGIQSNGDAISWFGLQGELAREVRWTGSGGVVIDGGSWDAEIDVANDTDYQQQLMNWN